jgi:hypothetical protein
VYSYVLEERVSSLFRVTEDDSTSTFKMSVTMTMEATRSSVTSEETYNPT